jgi:FkbM family methyltransferase
MSLGSAVPVAQETLDWRLVTPRTLFAGDSSDWESRCRRLAMGVYVGDDTVLCRTLARFKMFVSTKDEGLAPHLISDGYWEMWVTRVMTDVVQPGMVCIDAGANVGYYTVLMADLAGPRGRVLAFEPIPGTRRLLRRNVYINGFDATASVSGSALGSRQGEVTLYVPPGEPKNAMICEASPHPYWEAVKAPLQRIDDLGLPRIDFVKIDVEGAEIDVWKGMQQSIEQNPEIQIMMEVNCSRYGAGAATFLSEIADTFPLRYIHSSAVRMPTTAAVVLAAGEDVMLYLSRT